MAEVCVMGLGYVGLPTASLLATAGFHVLGVDVDPVTVEVLNAGKTRLQEAGLATLVAAAVRSGNLVAQTEPEESNAFIICVPTPLTDEKKVDLKAVEGATRSVASVVKKGDLVILESTSPVGTTSNVVGRILAEKGLEPGRDVDLCYCPERVLPGNTVGELVNNDRIIGGLTPESAERAREIYERFCQGKVSITDDTTAEMCKLMENSYRDVNIALANAFARMAEDAGSDVWKAIELANLHPRVNILRPGPGVGGHCIPVDPWFLVERFPDHGRLLREARDMNDGQARRVLTRLYGTGMFKKGDKLALLGAAYKADIDDARESPGLLMAEEAVADGCEVSVHDPLVDAGEHHGVKVSGDLRACLRDADAAVLLVEHKEYRSLSSKMFAETMRGRLVMDTRDWLNLMSLKLSGFTVLLLGSGAEIR